ncbi:cullin-3 [Linderina pennispora]|uniref:Cullin-3 n=1 Tax=Linderina pennispora TaxID=61395 RepID=A0A1Y1WJZ5_9FUNG|nr:cullin-3 [Linderina pennispora]ORX73675.1 cullin-3 [Linderina pennispora]
MSFANRRPGGRILPARRLTPQVDPKTQFEKLALAIGEIYKHNASKLSFEELYRTAYGLVLSKNGQMLYDGVKGVLERHLRECVETGIMQYAAKARDEPSLTNSEQFLSSVRLLWSEHVTAMLMIKDVLMYVDKVFVSNARLPCVYDMGMHVFRDQVFQGAEFRLDLITTTTLLSQIARERRGEHINKSTMRGITNMLVELQDKDQTRSVYKATFEPLLLADTRLRIRISELGTAEYMQRISDYLSSGTTALLRETVLQELISANAQAVLDIENAGLVQMLEQRSIASLAVLYCLYSQVPSAVKLLQDKVHSHIVSLGDHINAPLATADDAPKPGAKGKGPQERHGLAERTATAIRWVQDMLKLYDVYEEFLVESFTSNLAMRNAVNDAFIETINRNARSPEQLSLFIDDSLKRGLKGKAEQEVEHILERSVLLFRFLQNKDAFEHYYKLHLARRPSSLVSKLKVECGSQFTQKLEGMFKDIQLSADLVQAVKDADVLADTSFDMGVSVLTPTFWPSLWSTGADSKEELHVATDAYSMGNADIKVHFGSRTHELNVSTYQMLILMLFADTSDALTTEQIQQQTGIPSEQLSRQLQSLACAKYKILNKTPKSRDISPADSFAFNSDFRAPQYRIRIPLVAATNHMESDREKAASQAKISQERQLLIEAAIVRIMKDRKQMMHENLVNETIVQLSPRFLPSSKNIKEGIGKLIDREYLQRSLDDPRLYIYLA